MKNIIYFCGLFALTACTLVSCDKSSDDDTPLVLSTDTTKFDYGTSNLKHLVSVSGPNNSLYKYSNDDCGRVVSVNGKEDDYSYTYSCVFTGKTGLVKQQIIETEDGESYSYGLNGVIKLNDNGFMSDFTSKIGTNDNSLTFTYDADGYLVNSLSAATAKLNNKIYYEEKHSLNYSWENGSLVSYEDKGTVVESLTSSQSSQITEKVSFAYINSNVSTPIENTGRLNILSQDFEGFVSAYPLRYLVCGTASKYLPVEIKVENSDEGTNTYTFDWELDGEGYPVKVTISNSKSSTESYNFTWK